jgi:hypothetical protein
MNQNNAMPVIAVLGLGPGTIPPLLKRHMIDLKKIGCTIAVDELAPQGAPTVLVLGLNPKEHQIPSLLAHHLKKIQKDYPIAYGTEPKNEAYMELLQQSGFTPTPRKHIKRIIP